MSYNAPLKDMLFVLNELAGLKQINALPNCEDATPDTVEAILEENAKFAGEVIAPLNWPSDRVWWSGFAKAGGNAVSRNAKFRIDFLCSVPVIVRWRNRSLVDGW